MSAERDDSVGEFDETNGLAPGLEGDAEAPIGDQHEGGHGVLGDVVEDVATGFKDKDPDPQRDA